MHIGTLRRTFVCATVATQLWDINAFARVFHSSTSAIDALIGLTPNGTTGFANAMRVTLFMELNVCPTKITAMTPKPTAQWELTSILNKRSVWHVLMDA